MGKDRATKSAGSRKLSFWPNSRPFGIVPCVGVMRCMVSIDTRSVLANNSKIFLLEKLDLVLQLTVTIG
jgi:hypothetical protein